MKTLSAIAVTLLASSAAFAQPMGGHGGGERPQMMQMMGGHCMMMQRTEGALAFLKTELKISSSQEQDWSAFAAAYRDAAGAGHEGEDKHDNHKARREHGKAGSFLDKAKHHLEMMDTHHAGFRKVYDAAKPLYEALNAEQRKTADELLMHYLMPHHRGGM
jgi:LTXXQ motif family protein